MKRNSLSSKSPVSPLELRHWLWASSEHRAGPLLLQMELSGTKLMHSLEAWKSLHAARVLLFKQLQFSMSLSPEGPVILKCQTVQSLDASNHFKFKPHGPSKCSVSDMSYLWLIWRTIVLCVDIFHTSVSLWFSSHWPVLPYTWVLNSPRTMLRISCLCRDHPGPMSVWVGLLFLSWHFSQ